jgi:Tfp pilus assembly protein PilF
MSLDFRDAERLYERSLDVFPTAEASTFLGWTYSMQGNFAGAIRECERAIRIDPEFGNPYNDIGAYLIELGRWNEAIPWLERAVAAPRYEARHYAYMNLGRIYQREMEWSRAKEMLLAALALSPGYLPALLALRRMMSRFN